MYKQIKFKLTGVSPLLMHNGQLADPLNPIVKEMKRITAKGSKKTDEDHRILSDLEWAGSLYTSEPIEVSINGSVQIAGGGHLCIPPENIEAALILGGKKSRRGDAFKCGQFVEVASKLIHGGPSIMEMLAKPGYRDIRGVRVQRNRVMRTRPIFRQWGAEVEVQYLPSILNESHIIDAMTTVGTIIGIGDNRPKFGRFTVEAL